MSTLFGWMSLVGRPADRWVVQQMANTLLPFGRDRSNFHLDGSLAFGHGLWRVTPDDAFDRQPLHSESGRYLLSADIRIYNRAELIGDLGLNTHPVAQLADSALLLAAWERWQTEALKRIEGDYAFALWDKQARVLHLVRDPFGRRPLVWHQGKDFFAFASLPKALTVLPEVPRELNRGRVADQLAHLPWIGDDTLFQGVQRVLPGHRLEYSERGTQQIVCRRLDPDKRIFLKSDAEYLEAFGEHLERAVSERLRTTQGIASHLSSGYDSSTVTAVAARLLVDNGRRLTAFTAVPRDGFDGPVPKGRKANEGTAARALTERFPNIDHKLVAVSARSQLEGLHQANAAMEMPFLNPSNLPWIQQVNAEASDSGANVLLVGRAGNFTISHDGAGLLPALLRSGPWLHWWREARALHHTGRRWRGLLAGSFGSYLSPSLWCWLARMGGRDLDLHCYSPIHSDFARTIKLGERARMAEWDVNYQPKADTRKIRASAFERGDFGSIVTWATLQGVEIRDPTADFRLAEFCFAIPEDQFLRNGQSRWLLKRLMGDILPPEILYQQGGKGFQSADWFEGLELARAEIGEWIEQLEEMPTAQEILDLARMRSAYENWPADGWERPEIVRTYQLMLLRGLSMGSFIRYVEDGR